MNSIFRFPSAAPLMSGPTHIRPAAGAPVRRAPRAAAWLLALAAFHALPAAAADAERLLIIRDHRFEPMELRVPANERVKIVIHNQDAKAEEFDSHALNREKLVPAGAKVSVFVGPLKPGRYPFAGEYNEATAQGVVIAE